MQDAEGLRTTLNLARVNERIRERLQELVDDHERFSSLVRQFGPRHGLVQDLLALTHRTLELDDVLDDDDEEREAEIELEAERTRPAA